MFEAIQHLSKKPKAKSCSAFVQQLPHAPVALWSHLSVEEVTRACGSEDAPPPGDTQEQEPEKKYTRNGDPEDTKVERKGKQRIVGLLVDTDEGSPHRYICVFYTSGADRTHEDNTLLR